jgi:Cu/Ag efflux pump CusA
MAIGTSVLGGMITATFLVVFFIPLFYVAVVQVFGKKKVLVSPANPESSALPVKE